MTQQKILVVDDEAAIRNLFEQAFRSRGYTVICAETGEQALEIMSQENIPVIFLDLNLPGINGIEVCQKLREDHPMAIIHAVTGLISVFQLRDCRVAGFDDYFAKPVDLEVLFKAAKEAFERLDRWIGKK